MTPSCLNLGCGSRFHPAWINIDFRARPPHVRGHDLRRGIPLADGSFDVVYHSHVLEHFDKAAAGKFLRECARVLKPGGILRIAVPDLERIAREYIAALDLAKVGRLDAANRYNWMMLELLDQTVRETTGGDIAVYLSQSNVPAEEFVRQRLGVEAERYLSQRMARAPSRAKIARRFLTHMARSLMRPREALIRLLLGRDYAALKLGRFRLGGEIHKWMYDAYSLGQLLAAEGLEGILQRSAIESYIAHWSNFNLDTEADGSVYKPDSLFMEARKPRDRWVP